MKNNNCLSTRTDKPCPQCGEEFVLVDSTDVMAHRPTQVDLVCPDCHFPGRAILTEQQHFLSVFPSPIAVDTSPGSDLTRRYLTEAAFDPLPSLRSSSLEMERDGASIRRLLN